MTTREGKILTTAEVAVELGISRVAVVDAIRRGALQAELVSPRLYLVEGREVESYRRHHLGKQGWQKRRQRQYQQDEDGSHGAAP